MIMADTGSTDFMPAAGPSAKLIYSVQQLCTVGTAIITNLILLREN